MNGPISLSNRLVASLLGMILALCGQLFAAPDVAAQSADEAPSFRQRVYFKVRQDMRLCPSPGCGGFFIRKVNSRRTLCADGSWQRECYVDALRWDPHRGDPFHEAALQGDQLSNSPGASVVLLMLGRIRPNEESGAPDSGGNDGSSPDDFPATLFIARAVYAPATDADPTGIFVGLRNNGIVCIASPCFSFDEFILNTQRTREISGLDLSGVEAPGSAVDNAWELIANDQVLIAAGRNGPTFEPLGRGVTFRATQFYTPLAPSTD